MLTLQHQHKQTSETATAKPSNTTRLFVVGTKTDIKKLAPIFDSSAHRLTLLCSLPSFKRSRDSMSSSATSSAFSSSLHAGAGPSNSKGTPAAASASGAGTPKTLATATNNTTTSPSPAVPANQLQRPPNLFRTVAQTVICNIQSPNLYTQDDPLYVYKWFLGVQLKFDPNGRFVQLLILYLAP